MRYEALEASHRYIIELGTVVCEGLGSFSVAHGEAPANLKRDGSASASPTRRNILKVNSDDRAVSAGNTFEFLFQLLT